MGACVSMYGKETSTMRWRRPELGCSATGRKKNYSNPYTCDRYLIFNIFFSLWRNSPTRARANSFARFLDHTQWHTTVGRNPLDERSARRRDLYLTTHNTHNRQTSMPPTVFEPAIPASDSPQTFALNRSVICEYYVT
jgi:hypothetical protein